VLLPEVSTYFWMLLKWVQRLSEQHVYHGHDIHLPVTLAERQIRWKKHLKCRFIDSASFSTFLRERRGKSLQCIMCSNDLGGRQRPTIYNTIRWHINHLFDSSSFFKEIPFESETNNPPEGSPVCLLIASRSRLDGASLLYPLVSQNSGETDEPSMFPSSIDREGMCRRRPGGEGGWHMMLRGEGVGGSLMGNGIMVCGDTLMFNHKPHHQHHPWRWFSQARSITHHCGPQKSSLRSLSSEHRCKLSLSLSPPNTPLPSNIKG